MNFYQKIIYRLGLHSNLIKHLYHKFTGDWLWGLIGAITHYKSTGDEMIYHPKDYPEFCKMTEQLFQLDEAQK
jgi:hypothetical protein